MLIPAGTYVQGAISRVQRGGRLKGRAEILMHFTKPGLFPTGYTVLLPGCGGQLCPAPITEKMKDRGGTIPGGRPNREKSRDHRQQRRTGAVVGV